MPDDEFLLHDLTAHALLRRAVHGARYPHGNARKKYPRWWGIMEVFALGSTYSRDLCRAFDLDPDEMVSR